MATLIAEKLNQAGRILEELEIDAWLTFVRESSTCGDPVLPLILGQSLTWQSALLVGRRGERIAIVGRYDDHAVRSIEGWTDVRSYVQGIREPLVACLEELDPQSIAVNYSTDDVMSDGLSHGMFLLLESYLSDTPFAKRIRPATAVVVALRGRKSPAEIERIRHAIRETENIIRSVESVARIGATEREIAAFMKAAAARQGFAMAWEPKMCPIVNTGPDSMIGHGIPSGLAIAPGHVLHIDFGISREEYCSDLQRCWYIPRATETEPPREIRQAFDTVVRAISSAAATLRPGIAGWEVDAVARKTVVDAGYPEYQHATGHQVGRAAHDGGGVLGPRWERYGRLPYRVAETGNVFTLELGIENVHHGGYIGLEEMVLVTDDGCEFLSEPQTALPLLTGEATERRSDAATKGKTGDN